MILYHVSTDLKKDNDFYPRRPMFILDGEDGKTERICASPSIELCLSAIPFGGKHLHILNEKQHGFYKVFRIDTDKLQIKDENIVNWETLFNEEYVPDAEWTKEHWITTDFTVPDEDVFLIQVQYWNEKSCDLIPNPIRKLAEEEFDGDFSQAYEEVMNDVPKCITIIENTEYLTSDFKKGDTITLVAELLEIEEIDTLIEFIKDKYQCSLSYVAYSYSEYEVMEGELPIGDLADAMFSFKESLVTN